MDKQDVIAIADGLKMIEDGVEKIQSVMREKKIKSINQKSNQLPHDTKKDKKKSTINQYPPPSGGVSLGSGANYLRSFHMYWYEINKDFKHTKLRALIFYPFSSYQGSLRKAAPTWGCSGVGGNFT